jgi:hypothetical protein
MEKIGVHDVHIQSGGEEVVEYIRDNHYSGTCNPISNIWGLYTDDSDELVGGIVFANPMSEKVREFISDEKKEVTELHRLYTDDRCGKNVESWFIAHALDLLKKKKPKYRFVVSYSDITEGHKGTVYQATNALYIGMAQERTFYRDEEGNLRSPRIASENITHEMAEERGWQKEKRESKHRYVFPLPDQYESRSDVIKDLKPEPQDYPE